MEIRACCPTNYDQVLEMLNEVYVDAFQLEPALQHRHPLLLGKENCQHMLVAWQNDQPVSAFNYFTSTYEFCGAATRMASVGCVGTPAIHSGKGYASVLMNEAEEQMKREGVRVEIISGGRSLYLRKGATHAQQWTCVTVAAHHALEDEPMSVVRYELNQLPAIRRLYDAEPFRHARTQAQWEKMLRSNLMDWGGRQSQLFCFMNKGTMGAYVFVDWNEKQEALNVREYAGDRKLLADGLPVLCAQLKKIEAELRCTNGDPFLHYAQQAGWGCKSTPWVGTFKILDVAGLWSDMQDYIQSRLEKPIFLVEENGEYTFQYGTEALQVGALAALQHRMFGSPVCNEGLVEPTSKIEQALNKVLPLPLMWPENLNCQ